MPGFFRRQPWRGRSSRRNSPGPITRDAVAKENLIAYYGLVGKQPTPVGRKPHRLGEVICVRFA